MTRSRSITFLAGATAIPLTALAIAAAGSDGGDASASTAPRKISNGPPAMVRAANPGSPRSTVETRNRRLGTILVDSQGRTLYLFKKDSGTKSACFGACATAWPPLRANGKPTAGSGAKASSVGTTKRSDGKPQVTYNRHPLYRFTGDQKAGDTNGEGLNAFGARWFAVSPQGNQVSG